MKGAEKPIEKTKKLNVAAQKEIKQIKIAIVGDCMTGKSCFVQRFINKGFANTYQPTLGVDTTKKSIQNKNGMVSTLTFWDFSGKLDFLDIRNEFYKDTFVTLVFVDLSNKKTIDSIDYWVREAKDNGATNVLVIGNKADIKKIEDAGDVAKSKGCGYLQVSAKSGDNVEESINKIISDRK